MIPVHETPFVVSSSVIPDREGVEQLIVILKATFDIGEDGNVAPAEEQDPIVGWDELRGDAITTSIVREGEMMPPKPLGTDVFLIGHAVAPKRGISQMQVRFRVGPVDKHATVFGDRYWVDDGTGKPRCTEPNPFDEIPLIYENAFGGEDRSLEDDKDWEREARNPIGRGFRADKSPAEWKETQLPNIEDPAALISHPDDRPTPIAFGPIGRHWEPRLDYTGTYDESWAEERAPLLAADFDERFHHAVPTDQIVEGHLRGGEAVEVIGCTPSGSLSFSLPVLRPQVTVDVYLKEEGKQHQLVCDSVTVDTDRMKLLLVYKAMMALPADLVDVREIKITPAEEPTP